MAERPHELGSIRAARFEQALFALLSRFHRDSTCGRHGPHWPECEARFTQLGWSGYESYAAEMQKLHAWEGTQVARPQRAPAPSASER